MSPEATVTDREPLLQIRGITKRFPGVLALDHVDLELRRGEIHVLVGHNGAGKSTLIKILSGVYRPDSGEIITSAGPVVIREPADAQRAGIATIHQEISLCAHLSVYENLILGREPITSTHQIARKRAAEWAREHLMSLGIDVDPRLKVDRLSLPIRQLVAIAKALAADARILILDEPTAVLSGADVEKLFVVLRGLRDRGTGIIYVSHRLAELHEIGDRLTVFRDGRRIETGRLEDQSTDRIVELMVGGDLDRVFPPLDPPKDRIVLSLRGVELQPGASPIDLDAREGEILGITGIVASGKEELAQILSGGRSGYVGEVQVEGVAVRLTNRLKAANAGLGYLSPDRRGEALILERDAIDNVTLVSLSRYCRFSVLQGGRRKQATSSWIERLGVRGPGLKATLRLYSGGNQQKISVAKWLDARSKILVMVEPTTGLDVGAKVDVYRLLRDLAKSGVTIILVSSDLEEVAGMSHRILVLRDREVAAEFANGMTGLADILYEAVVGSRPEGRGGEPGDGGRSGAG